MPGVYKINDKYYVKENNEIAFAAKLLFNTGYYCDSVTNVCMLKQLQNNLTINNFLLWYLVVHLAISDSNFKDCHDHSDMTGMHEYNKLSQQV